MTQLGIVYIVMLIALIGVYFWIKSNKHLKDKSFPAK